MLLFSDSSKLSPRSVLLCVVYLTPFVCVFALHHLPKKHQYANIVRSCKIYGNPHAFGKIHHITDLPFQVPFHLWAAPIDSPVSAWWNRLSAIAGPIPSQGLVPAQKGQDMADSQWKMDKLGLVSLSHFGNIGHHKKKIAIKKTINTYIMVGWCEQWGHLMTHDKNGILVNLKKIGGFTGFTSFFPPFYVPPKTKEGWDLVYPASTMIDHGSGVFPLILVVMTS